MTQEIIVVEGKDDAGAVKRACPAEVIITSGLGLTEKTLERIRTVQRRCGVIILTDPDYPGEKIRRIIDEAVPGCRHAYIYQQNKGKIGVEYASPEEIRAALAAAHLSVKTAPDRFTMEDLYAGGLAGSDNSGQRRRLAGKILGLGETNAKQFLKRLNAYNISREEFEQALAGSEE
ncbi:MAG: ribonuclease M5 [Clostridia bacterium]|jgi:ribonuclease M5|nr:ribonuclease M5 [Clostridia bacterium]